MAKIDFILDIFDAVSRKDWERLIKAGEDLASSESKRKHYSVASRLREAIESMKNDLDNDDTVVLTSTNSITNFEYLQQVDTSNIDDIFLEKGLNSEVQDFYKEWESEEKLATNNLAPRNSILLYGPPGSGKTLLATHISKKLNLPIFIIRFDSLISSFLGETSSNLKRVFEFAKYNRCILFLDELDAIGKSRDDSSELGELKRVVISLLQNIDLHDSKSIIIAATNHPQILDSAIWRRFEIIWELKSPTKDTIQGFIKSNFPQLNEEKVVLATESLFNLSGSDIKMIFQQAHRKSIISSLETSEALFLSIIEFHRRNSQNTTKENFNSSLLNSLKALKLYWPKKYTYADLESVSGLPHSTIHNKLKSKRAEINQ